MKSFKQFLQFVESATARYTPNIKSSYGNTKKVQQMMFAEPSLIPLTPPIVKLFQQDIKPISGVHLTAFQNAINIVKNQGKKVTNLCTMREEDARKMWQGGAGGGPTGGDCFVKVTGTPLAVSNVDLWSMPDIEGRRWIGYRSLKDRASGKYYEGELRAQLDSFWKDYDKTIDGVWEYATALAKEEGINLPKEKDDMWSYDYNISPKSQAKIIKYFFDIIKGPISKHKGTLKWYFFVNPGEFDDRARSIDIPPWSELIINNYTIDFMLLNLEEINPKRLGVSTNPDPKKAERLNLKRAGFAAGMNRKWDNHIKPILGKPNIYGLSKKEFESLILSGGKPNKSQALENFQSRDMEFSKD